MGTRHSFVAEDALHLAVQISRDDVKFWNFLFSFEYKLCGSDDYIYILRKLGNRGESNLQNMMSFDKLKLGKFDGQIVVRVINFWDSINLKKGGILNGWELLLIDEQSVTLQGFIPAHKIGLFDSLKRNSIYKLTNLWVQASYHQYRVSEHQYTVCFTDKTVMTELEEGTHSIETQKFRIRSFQEFESITNTNTDLYDVIGQIRHIEGDTLHQNPAGKSAGKSSQMIGVHLELQDGTIVRIKLWEKAAVSFREKYLEKNPPPVVALITTVNPKRLTEPDRFFLNSMHPTRVFFDHETETSSHYLTALGDNAYKPANTNSSAAEITKLETVTLGDIHQFLSNENPQKASFICLATVADVLGDYGWHYISCGKCSTKLGRTDTNLVCNKCNDDKALGVIRFRVELLVKDEADQAVFVLFDRDVAKLTGWQAPALLEASTADGPLPKCLLDTIGMTMKFQVKVTEYNFHARRQTITVSRILQLEEDNDNTTADEGIAESTENKDTESPDPNSIIDISSGELTGDNHKEAKNKLQAPSILDDNKSNDHKAKRIRRQR